jgi:hypothetical protein
MTAWEQTLRTMGSPATAGWSKVCTPADKMAIANVCQ